MATIRTPCPACGLDAELAPQEVALRPDDSAAGHRYAFTCPGCTQQVEKPAARPAVRLLRLAGVQWEHEDVLPAGPHPERPLPGPPLTAEDILEFRDLLDADPHVVDTILRTCPPQS